MSKSWLSLAKLVAMGAALAAPALLLAWAMTSRVEISLLASKAQLSPALFFGLGGFWGTLVYRAHDLRKFQLLSSIEEDAFLGSLSRLTSSIWAAVLFNVVGILLTILMSAFSSDAMLAVPLVFLVLFWLVASVELTLLVPFFAERIENAKAAFSKREKQEKDRDELIKAMRAVSDKYKPDPRYDQYTKLADLTPPPTL